MDYMTVKQAAEKWERSVRWVQVLCKTDGVPGAVRFGRDWMIPKDAPRPPDRRKSEYRKKDGCGNVKSAGPKDGANGKYKQEP